MNPKFTGSIEELIKMTHFCEIAGIWYYSEKNNTFELSSSGTCLTWNVSSGELDGFADRDSKMFVLYELIDFVELNKRMGVDLPLPEPSSPVAILPMRTTHTLGCAYNLLHNFNRRTAAQGAKSDGRAKLMSSGSRMLAMVAKPKTPAQKTLCDQFGPHLDRAEQANVPPDAFEKWIGKGVLNAWSLAAAKIRMFSETEGTLHRHDYLSDEDRVAIRAHLAPF
jgi:hypothetical protein